MGNEKDNTTIGGKIPQTGVTNYIIGIVAVTIMAVISYLGYRKYKNI